MKRTKSLNRAILIVGAAIVLLAVALLVFAPDDPGGRFAAQHNRIMNGHFDGFREHPPGRVFIPLLAIGLFVLFAGRAVHRTRLCGHGGARSSAENILREKFASGEIDREEYQARRRVLEDDDDGGLI